MTEVFEKELLSTVRAALLMVVASIEKITGLVRKCKRCGAEQ